MNKIYKVIWNHTLNTFVVVSELAKGCVKSSSSNNSSPSKFSQAFKLTLLSLLLGVSLPSPAYIAIGSVENNTLKSSGADAADSNQGTYPLDYKNPGNKSYNDKGASISGGDYSNNTSFGIAIGNHSSAIVSSGSRRSNGIAIGDYSKATGGLSMALGSFSVSENVGSIAVGAASRASGFNSLSMMRQSAAIGDYSTAIGSVSWANGTASFALGASATAFGNQSIAIGSVSPRTLSVPDGSVSKKITKYDGANRTQTNGNNSIAMGTGAKTNGHNSFAIGSGAETGEFKSEYDRDLEENVTKADNTKSAQGAMAFGVNAKAKDAKAIAFGEEAKALKQNAMAFGASAQASQQNAMAFGASAQASQQNAMAFGASAQASQQNAMAFGTNAQATVTKAIAIGSYANATSGSAVAIGSEANAIQSNATAIGTTSNASQANSTALGFGAQATDADSVALGANSKTATKVATSSQNINGISHNFAGGNPIGTVSVGDTNKHRTITNVAAGRISDSSTDAINGSQLYSVITEVNKGWNITTAADGGEVIGNKSEKVKLGDTLTVKAGTNIKITQAGKNLTVATKDNVTFNKVDAETLNVSGDTTVKNLTTTGDTKVKNFTVDPNSNINMGNNRITNVGTPTSDTDAANKKYVDQGRTVVTSQDNSVTINTSTLNGGGKAYDLKVNAEFKYTGDNNSNGSNKLSTETAFKGTSNEIVTSASNGQITFGLHQEAKNALNLAKTAIQNFTVGAGATTSKISVNNTEKHFDIVGSENYVTTQVEGRNIKIGLGDKAKNAIDNVTTKKITITGGNTKAHTFTVAEGGDIKVIAKPGNEPNIIEVAADTVNKAITVGVNKANFDTAVTNNTQVQANKNKLTELEPKVNENKQNIASLDTKVTENKNEINNLKPQVTANKTEIDKLKPKVEKNTNDLNILNTTVQAGWELTINDNEKVKDVTPTDRKANFKSGDNIVITKENNSVKIATSLTPKFTNATFGDNGDKTVINKDGITISNTNPDKSVSLTDSGLDNGGNKIQNIANGTSPNDAVNMSQLNAVNATANAGWKLQVNKKSDSESVVTPNATVSLNNEDNNIQITKTKNDNNVNFALNTKLTLGKGDPNGEDGSLTVKGKNGSSVALNGKDGSIGLTGPAGADGKPEILLKVAKDKGGVSDADGVKNNRITYTNGNNATPEIVATLNDGLKFKGDDADIIKKKLNEQLEIIGGADKNKLTNKNIGVNSNGGKLEIKLSKELSDLTSAEFGTGNDKTGINKDGITITNNGNTIALTENGLNNGDKQITNVASGLGDNTKLGDINAGDNKLKNAANIGDLKNAITDVVSGGFGLKDDNAQEVKQSLGTSIKVQGDGSITTKVVDKNGDKALQVGLTNNVTVGDTTQPGTVTVRGENGADSITLNGKDGTIGLKGKDGASANITVTNGPSTLDGPKNTTNTPRISYNNGNTKEYLATTNDGLIFGANDGAEHKAKLNTKVDIKGDAANTNWNEFDRGKNLMTKVDSNQKLITIALSKALKDLTSATFTNGQNPATTSVLDGKGLKITPNGDINKVVSLTDAGLNNGGNQISNVASGLGTQTLETASGDTLTNAVNVQDLKNAITKTVGESGWNLQTNNDTPTKVGHNDTVKFINGENIEITRPAGSRDITISTSKDLNVNTVKAGKKASGTDVGTDGAVTAEGKDGSSVALNGKDGSISVSNKGADGSSANITVKQGKPDLQSSSGANKTRIVYTPENGQPEEVATLKDGLKFKGDTGAVIEKHLNDTLTIKGNVAEADAVTDKNLRVDSEDGNLILKMAKSLQDLNDITFGDKNSNDKSFINKDGLTITNNGNTVKLTENGLDNGGHQVTNVGSGLTKDGQLVDLTKAEGNTLKNAANIGDLKNAITDLTDTNKGGFGLKDDKGNTFKQKLGETAQIKGDGSVVTKVIPIGNNGEKALQVGLNKDITVGDATNPGSIKIKGSNDKDTISLNGQDGTIKLKDANGGDRVSLNGNDGSIGLTGKDGVNGTLTFAKGDSHIDGTVGAKETTRISYTSNNGTPEFVATLNDGLKFGANTGNVRNAKLNSQIDVKGDVNNKDWAKFDAGKNIMTSITDGTITVGLAKALTDLESVTFNKNTNGNPTASTKIDSNGLTITPTNNNNKPNKAVSLTDNGLNNGGNKITNVDKGEVSATSTDAVNGAQLHEVKETANAGWNLSVNNTNSSNVKPTNTVDLSNSDGNLVISKVIENDKHKVDFKLGDKLSVKESLIVGPKDNAGNPTEGAVIIGKDGRDGKNNENTIALVGKDGKDAVAIKGKDGVGTIGLTGKAGQDGTSTSAELSIAEGAKGLDGNDRQNSENKTRIVYKKPDDTTEEVATLNDGLIFVGNDAKNVTRKLNTTLKILGGIDNATELAKDSTSVSSDNLGVRWKDADSLEIVMKERPTFSGLVLNGKDGQPAKIDFKDANGTQGMSISGSNGNNGDPSLVIKNKDGQDGVTFTNDGRITNVADGKDTKDAVNFGQLNKVKDELVNQGFGIKAETGGIVNKALGQAIEVVGADSNISTKVADGKVKIELAKTINLGDDGSVTAGKTVLNKDGVKVGDKVALTEEGLKVGDKVKVTESGLKVGDKVNITEAGITVGDVVINKDTGINAGNKAITNVADGDISATSKEAVNGSQLFKEAAKAKTEVEAGENIVVTPRDGANGQKIYTVATKKDVSFDNVKVGDISINKNDGINAGNKKISNVADGKIGEGSKDAVNGHQLFTEAAKAKSEVVKGTNIASVDTTVGDKGQTIYTVNADGTTVSAGSDKVTVTKGTKDTNNVTDYKVDLAQATKDDIAKGVDAKTQVDKGINFAGGDGKSTNYKLGDTITIAGDNNVTTETTDKGVTVKLNKDVNLNSVSANTFKAGGVTISADSGINAGGKQITHVASGLVDKNGNKVHIRNASGDTLNNAVNVGDLKSVAGDIYNNIDTTNKRVDKLDKRVRGIGANSAAAASLPQVYIPGKSMVAASAGGYGGEAAVALGYSRASDNGKVILKLTGTANSAGHYSGGVGVGYQW
ncbi:ESPR-type extended signal peptide-containing protein [Bisgaard Taxon 46]